MLLYILYLDPGDVVLEEDVGGLHVVEPGGEQVLTHVLVEVACSHQTTTPNQSRAFPQTLRVGLRVRRL